MKTLIILAALLLIKGNAWSQLRDTTQTKLNTALMLRAKQQRSTARILLMSGTVLNVIGLCIMAHEASAVETSTLADVFSSGLYEAPAIHYRALGDILFYGGGAAMIGSIPLFISSGKKHRQAGLLAFKQDIELPAATIKQAGFSIQIHF